MRLIDADKLTNQLENKKVSITYEIPIEEVLGENIDLDDFEELVKDAIKSYRKMILDTIKTMPAIEQRPKGKWIKHIDDLFPAESTMECNVCHEEQNLFCDENFCPNCGADMRETENKYKRFKE